MGLSMFGLLVLLLFQSVQKAPLPIGVGAELLARNLPVPKDAADLEQPITSYSVLDDSRGFVIAYYGLESDNSLHELRIRSYDKRTRTWRSKTFPEPIGSIVDIQRSPGYLYVTGHSSPSAAPTLVLTERLEFRHELDGWLKLMLDNGRVVFSRSMVHFAPAHAGVLALYDPVANREDALYPANAVKTDRGVERLPGNGLFVDRSFSDLKKGRAPGTIEFIAVVQKMRLNQQNGGDPAGPEQRFRVNCDLLAQVCRERIQD
jgi:hypothetical protein